MWINASRPILSYVHNGVNPQKTQINQSIVNQFYGFTYNEGLQCMNTSYILCT